MISVRVMGKVVMDAHCHVGRSWLMLYLKDRNYTAEDLIACMDECGVDMAVVSGSGRAPEIMEWNKRVLEAVKKYPNRLMGFVRINPLLEDAMETIEHYVKDYGFNGIKLHPMQDFYQSLDPAAQEVLSKAAKLRVPVMIHSGTDPWTMPGQIADLADMYPEVPVIMAHSGHGQLYQHAVPSARRVKNIILETSGHPGWQVFTNAVKTIGADRVVYGSDWPCASMKAEMMKIKRLPISEEEKGQVLGGSLAKILGFKGEEE